MTARPSGNPQSLDGWRRQLRHWLEHNAPRWNDAGSLDFSERRAWERKLYEAGYAAIHWPVEFGGRGADLPARIVFQEEYERAQAPDRLNWGALMLAGPTLMHFGTKEQQERWLEPILRCDELWCQGFSEPDAGSDLASLRCSAVRDGEDFVVNGQKIWTSEGESADWMFALVRTDPSAPKHRGISFIMIDMSSPGIDVRPIRQINGWQDFAEVFFTDVRVPAANVVGNLNDGWRIAMTALGFERGAGRRTYVKFLNDLSTLREFVNASEQGGDLAIREELGERLRDVLVYRHHVNRTVAESQLRGDVGPEASFNKLYWSEMQTRIYELGMKVLGSQALVQGDNALVGAREWQETYWYSRAARIFAGTNEIQKNVIAERVLGLPKEPR